VDDSPVLAFVARVAPRSMVEVSQIFFSLLQKKAPLTDVWVVDRA